LLVAEEEVVVLGKQQDPVVLVVRVVALLRRQELPVEVVGEALLVAVVAVAGLDPPGVRRALEV
jgi:hypothetical protein